MTPQHQTIFGAGKGNCYATCIACLLDLEVEDVPNFCVDYPADEWFQETQRWLAKRGTGTVYYTGGQTALDELTALYPAAYCIVAGPGPRGCDHVVIYRGGEMVHDPHPSGAGLVEVEGVELFVVLDPSLVTGGVQ